MLMSQINFQDRRELRLYRVIKHKQEHSSQEVYYEFAALSADCSKSDHKRFLAQPFVLQFQLFLESRKKLQARQQQNSRHSRIINGSSSDSGINSGSNSSTNKFNGNNNNIDQNNSPETPLVVAVVEVAASSFAAAAAAAITMTATRADEAVAVSTTTAAAAATLDSRSCKHHPTA
jgi:hypothetical protein